MKLKQNFDKGFYLISDIHFGHHNILEFCNRPFANVDIMNETIFENWNATVTDEDIIIFVGDFAFAPKSVARMLWENLNGQKIMILGNHDKKMKNCYPERVSDDLNEIHTLTYKGYEIGVNHFPPKGWANVLPDNKLFIHGHVHSNQPTTLKNVFNVSCEMTEYKPIFIDEVIKRIKKQNKSLVL